MVFTPEELKEFTLNAMANASVGWWNEFHWLLTRLEEARDDFDNNAMNAGAKLVLAREDVGRHIGTMLWETLQALDNADE